MTSCSLNKLAHFLKPKDQRVSESPSKSVNPSVSHKFLSENVNLNLIRLKWRGSRFPAHNFFIKNLTTHISDEMIPKCVISLRQTLKGSVPKGEELLVFRLVDKTAVHQSGWFSTVRPKLLSLRILSQH